MSPIPAMSTRDIARFWRKVVKAPDGCWMWAAGVNEHGYGLFGIGRRCYLAHRVSFVLTTGADVPDGRILCHTCDTPACVNAQHLYPGTPAQNSADMVARGRARSPRGLDNGRAKLSDADVEAIRLAHAAGESCKSIARRTNLHASYVGRLVRKVRRP